jgi:hypothetical protein
VDDPWDAWGTPTPVSEEQRVERRVDPERVPRQLPVVPLMRAPGVVLVPAAVLLHSRSGLSWVVDASPARLAVVVFALTLALVGLRWLWVATTPPYALRRRTARAIEQAQVRLDEQAREVADMLDAVREDRASDATWAAFEERTGLDVPPSTRSALDPGMDPVALARYLGARSQTSAAPAAASPALVALVPLLTCLVPAALLLALV